jgi:hypothetical protein
MTATAKNGRLRERRKKIWRMAEAATRYWRARLDFDHAVSIAQMMEMPEAAYHPVVDSKDHMPMVRRYREALVRHSPPHLMLTRANGSRRPWPGATSLYRCEARADRARDRGRSGISRCTSSASIKPQERRRPILQGLPAMNELTPKDVLVDLFAAAAFRCRSRIRRPQLK